MGRMISLPLIATLTLCASLAEGGVTAAWVDGNEVNVADLAKVGIRIRDGVKKQVIVDTDGELGFFAVASKGGGCNVDVEIFAYADDRPGASFYSKRGEALGRQGVSILRDKVKGLGRRKCLIVVETSGEVGNFWVD